MKTRIVSLLAVILTAGVISCSPDEFTVSGVPKMPPVVSNFLVDAVVIPGVPADLGVVVNGTEANPVGSVLLEIMSKGSDEVLKTITITPPTSANTGQVEAIWAAADSEVQNMAPGDYMLRATASNANGKTIGQTQFTVLFVEPSCIVNGMITVILYTPQSIPADSDIGAVGSFAGSGWGTDFIMTPLGNGYYCVSLPLVGGDAFKFRINASWGTEEKTSDCGGAPNREAPGGVWPNITVQTVPKWGGFGC
jgi:hypothetical protein